MKDERLLQQIVNRPYMHHPTPRTPLPGLRRHAVEAVSEGKPTTGQALDVMQEQAELAQIVTRFDPRIVKMCDDGSKAED